MSTSPINGRYDPRQRHTLLDIARRALTIAVMHKAYPGEFPADEALSQSGGAFVTLHCRGRLRGCIGQFATDLPLVQVVAHCAAVASEDPRFRAVEPTELDEIKIEISILSAATEIKPDEIEIGCHGLIVTSRKQRGVLLPQVAGQYKWTPERFLQETCVKAGLDRNAWMSPDTRIEAFTAETFSESQEQPAKDRQPDERAALERGYSTST
jgi:AmmeMemoRadiSam system protein A